jgi:phytoene desaturase
VKDPRLRTVLSFHPLLIGGNPFTATSVYALIAHLERRWGVHFAMGGTAASRGAGRADRGPGRNGALRPRGQPDPRRRAPHRHRGAADVGRGGRGRHRRLQRRLRWTYRHLLPPEVRRRWTDRKIERARYSMSLFVWYFGTRRSTPM